MPRRRRPRPSVGDIPWNRSLTITRTSSDDDIKNVFRSILQANGLSVAFGPAVHDTVSFHMEQVPIQQAFEQVIDQHHLTYSYNDSHQDRLHQRAQWRARGDAKSSAFITLVRHQLSGSGAGDQQSGPGPGRPEIRRRVPDPRGFAAMPTASSRSRPWWKIWKARASRGGQGSGANLGPEEVKVIPLRFTDVGPSTRQFQGKTVTVPGIADTLEVRSGSG